MAEIIKINENTYSIEDGMVRFFLLIGEEKALMIDSGMTTVNAKEIAQTLTEKPIELINTHADRDHTVGNAAFDKVYLDLAEAVNLYKGRGEAPSYDIVPVYDGEIIELGDRAVEIISIPGHTQGSIAILDIKGRMLFTGDTVQTSNIFMFGPNREIHAFIKSLQRLEGLTECFDKMYSSHGTLELEPSFIQTLREGAEKVLAGEVESEEVDMFGNKVNLYKLGFAGILFDK